MISFQQVKEHSKQMARFIWSVGKIYIVWVLIYYFASNYYSYFCAPNTLLGIFAAPFLVPLPHCVGLRWCIQHGAEVITAMWVIFGSWLITQFTN